MRRTVTRRLRTKVDEELAAARSEWARRERFIDALLEAIDVGIVSCDADGVFVVNNRAERELFGLDGDLGGRPMDHLDPRIDVYDRDGTRLGVERYPLMRALRGEDVSRLEVLAGPAGGPYRELLVRARQITDEHDSVLGAVAALADVTTERAATRELANEHRRLVEAQRLGQIGSFEHDFQTGRSNFSDHLSTLWGLPSTITTPKDFLGAIVGADLPTLAETWRTACRQGGAHTAEVRIRRPSDGQERLLRINIEVELDTDGAPRQARGTHLDITDLTAAEAEARRASGFLNAVLAATPDLTFVSEVGTGAVIYGSPGQEVLGIDSTDLGRLGVDGLLAGVDADDRRRVGEAITRATTLAAGQVVTVQYRSRHADGTRRWLSHRITPFRRDGDDRVVEIVSVVRDVTEMVEAQERLVHAAHHDYLTGLPNRARLVERLEAALERSGRAGEEIAVLFCDLDGFKTVNDTGGHSAGDAVLVETARRLVAAVRHTDIVARVGGDEFAILIHPWGRMDYAREGGGHGPPVRGVTIGIAERALALVSEPIPVDGVSYRVSASIGITYASGGDRRSGGAHDAGEVLHRADAAMYRAKAAGKDGFFVLPSTVARSDPGAATTRDPGGDDASPEAVGQ